VGLLVFPFINEMEELHESFLKELGRCRTRGYTGGPKSTEYLVQRLSVVVQ